MSTTSPVANITGNSIEQFVRASIAIKGIDADKRLTHVRFKLDIADTPDMCKLLGFKGLKYHLRQSKGKFYFTVGLK